MAIDNLLGATVRIRRGWHGGRTGEVVAFDHQAGPPSSYTVIKVKLKGNSQPVMSRRLDDMRLSDLPGVSELPAAPPVAEFFCFEARGKIISPTCLYRHGERGHARRRWRFLLPARAAHTTVVA